LEEDKRKASIEHRVVEGSECAILKRKVGNLRPTPAIIFSSYTLWRRGGSRPNIEHRASNVSIPDTRPLRVYVSLCRLPTCDSGIRAPVRINRDNIPPPLCDPRKDSEHEHGHLHLLWPALQHLCLAAVITAGGSGASPPPKKGSVSSPSLSCLIIFTSIRVGLLVCADTKYVLWPRLDDGPCVG
jgi:hypothetical protein